MILIKQVASKKWDICHYWYFLDKSFKFQSHVCNGFHDVLIMFIDLKYIADLNICSVDYRCSTCGKYTEKMVI